MAPVIDDPIAAPSPVEIPLGNAPLVRVIAQLRFPLVIGIEQRDFIAPFQEAISSKYPVLRQEQTQGVVVSPTGVAQVPAQTAWRFADVEGQWRASLTQGFVALETTAYPGRADFLARLSEIVTALDKYIEPKLVDRLGLRYIDRISGEAVKDVAQLVRSELLGIAGTLDSAHVVHAISESLIAFDGAHLLARWGHLPGGTTIDPAAMEPIEVPSWILDIDMFSGESRPFSVDRVMNDAKRFAERIYTFFRWAVTEDFLRRYGGKL